MSTEVIQKLWGYVKRVFSDAGEPSFSRWSSGAIVLTTLFWVTYLVIKNHILPDLEGPAIFLGSGTGSSYGINRISSMLEKRGQGPTPPPTA